MNKFLRPFVNTLQRIGWMICLLWPVLAQAQEGPVKGVVWEMGEERQAVGDLLWMRQIGVEAVRTGPIESERVLTVADSLGLQLYQELPVRSLPAVALRDTLNDVFGLLNRMLARALAHPSARHFGLAQQVDTSDPAACAYIERLARQVRQQAIPGAQVYYVTAFAEVDRCAGAVDFVLVSARDGGSQP